MLRMLLLAVGLLLCLAAGAVECKQYTRCTLMRELIKKHHVPRREAAMWTCIAQHESTLNTAAVGRKSGLSQTDHGLFQLSERWWCGKRGQISCKKLEDDDIRDDLKLAREVRKEQGYKAWSTYPKCRKTYLQYLSC